MGDRILVTALCMETILKNNIGELRSSVTQWQEAASYERVHEKELRNMIVLWVGVNMGGVYICMQACIHKIHIYMWVWCVVT